MSAVMRIAFSLPKLPPTISFEPEADYHALLEKALVPIITRKGAEAMEPASHHSAQTNPSFCK